MLVDRTLSTEHCRPNTVDRTPSTEHRRPNTVDRTPSTEHRRPNTVDRTLSTEHRRPNTVGPRRSAADRDRQGIVGAELDALDGEVVDRVEGASVRSFHVLVEHSRDLALLAILVHLPEPRANR